MRRRIALYIMTLFVACLLTGCLEGSENAPEVLQRAYIRTEYGIDEGRNIIYLDEERSDIAKRCFESIEYQGYVFALPMNVSDLPEGLSLEIMTDYYDNEHNIYNGYNITFCYVMRGEHYLLGVEVLHKIDEEVENGQIVSMSFEETAGFPSFGDVIEDNTSVREIKDIFGEFEAKTDWCCCNYILEDGRVLEIVQMGADELPPEAIYLYMDTVR